jgi:hypothetical protein
MHVWRQAAPLPRATNSMCERNWAPRPRMPEFVWEINGGWEEGKGLLLGPLWHPL